MLRLSKVYKPDNFEWYNSLNLSITNMKGCLSNFVSCELFLESNSPNIFAFCKTYLEDIIDTSNFSDMSCIPVIWKDSVTLLFM